MLNYFNLLNILYWTILILNKILIYFTLLVGESEHICAKKMVEKGTNPFEIRCLKLLLVVNLDVNLCCCNGSVSLCPVSKIYYHVNSFYEKICWFWTAWLLNGASGRVVPRFHLSDLGTFDSRALFRKRLLKGREKLRRKEGRGPCFRWSGFQTNDK